MKSFSLSSNIPAFMLFLSLAASASVKRDGHNDSTVCTPPGIEKCYELLGMSEACGLNGYTREYSSGVTDETFLKCICSAINFKPAATTCAEVLPEHREELNKLIKSCDEDGHYKSVRARSPSIFTNILGGLVTGLGL